MIYRIIVTFTEKIMKSFTVTVMHQKIYVDSAQIIVD